MSETSGRQDCQAFAEIRNRVLSTSSKTQLPVAPPAAISSPRLSRATDHGSRNVLPDRATQPDGVPQTCQGCPQVAVVKDVGN